MQARLILTFFRKQFRRVEANGYTYDDTVYTVIVEVTDAGEGKLNVQKTIVKADESARAVHLLTEAVFTNTYSAEGSITSERIQSLCRGCTDKTAGKSSMSSR